MWGVHPESSQTPGWVVRESAGRVFGFHPGLMEGFQAKRQKHQGISKGFPWDLGNTVSLVCGHDWSSGWHTLSLAVLCGFMSLSFPCLGPLLADYF